MQAGIDSLITSQRSVSSSIYSPVAALLACSFKVWSNLFLYTFVITRSKSLKKLWSGLQRFGILHNGYNDDVSHVVLCIVHSILLPWSVNFLLPQLDCLFYVWPHYPSSRSLGFKLIASAVKSLVCWGEHQRGVVGRTTNHRSLHMLEVTLRLVKGLHASVNHKAELRKELCHVVHELVVQWRDGPVLRGREPATHRMSKKGGEYGSAITLPLQFAASRV